MSQETGTVQFCDLLDREILPMQNRAAAAWRSLIEKEDFYDSYVDLLKYTYGYVRHSVELMERACEDLGHQHSRFRRYLRCHIKEEVGHEAWVLDDLRYLGIDDGAVQGSAVNPIIARMVGSQYYAIENIHPLSLFGYIYVLEAKGLKAAHVFELSKSFGIPINAMTTLMRHAEEDIGHAADLTGLINSVLDDGVHQGIICSAGLALESICEIYAAVNCVSLGARIPRKLPNY